MRPHVSAERLAFQSGIKETRQILKEWAGQPCSLRNSSRCSPKISQVAQLGLVARPWLSLSLIIAIIMFCGALAVAEWLPQTAEVVSPLFVTAGNSLSDALWLLGRNLMVLLLHLLVCVAAYLARRSIPFQAQNKTGLNRWMHHNIGKGAMLVVAGMTAYSLTWQTWQLGNVLHSAAETLNISSLDLLLRASLHGLPELVAVFLPLAACLMLGFKKQWNRMLAAAVLCAMISIPMLIMAVAIETWVTYRLF